MVRRLVNVSFLSLSCLAVALSSAACLKFGDDVVTTEPSAEHLATCRAEFYLNKSLKMTPVGFKLLASGIDRAIWFKFTTKAKRLEDIFDSSVVDIKLLKGQMYTESNTSDLPWWDTANKKLEGGQVALPNARYMNVGIDNAASPRVVYIMWNET